MKHECATTNYDDNCIEDNPYDDPNYPSSYMEVEQYMNNLNNIVQQDNSLSRPAGEINFKVPKKSLALIK